MPLRIPCVLSLALALTATAGEEMPSLGGQLRNPDAWKSLGQSGCLVIRSGGRWDEVQKAFARLGWEKPAENPLAEVDFGRDLVVCLFRNGDVADKFSVRGLASEGGQAQLDVVMSYIIYKSHVATPPRWNFLLAAVPRTKALKVTVSTYHPMNGGPYPTPDKAQLEWARTFAPTDGDVVDGLSGVIRAETDAVKAGDDIPAEFKLVFDSSAAEKAWHFALKLDSACVWDGKYSNGYRNHAFLVETPDGRSLFLRRPEQPNWDKNAPHPVQIEAGKPYVLPEWYEGKTFKSLKALGLDTAQPGIYRITGIYTETAGEATDWRTQQKIPMWGGNLATNTIEVTVK